MEIKYDPHGDILYVRVLGKTGDKVSTYAAQGDLIVITSDQECDVVGVSIKGISSYLGDAMILPLAKERG